MQIKFQVTELHANRLPRLDEIGNKDNNQVLLRLQETLEQFLTIGHNIIKNYPLAVGSVFEQLNSALESVRINGKLFCLINKKSFFDK